MITGPASHHIKRLQHTLKNHGQLAIAVSGGVDSMTLAFVAHRTINVEVIHSVSPAVPKDATALVEEYAKREGWHLTMVESGEFQDENYLSNPVNRCFFCKENLYDRIGGTTKLRIASGANLDDLGDYRPGLLAAERMQVVHPLVEAKIDKAAVRDIARENKLLDLADLPAQPCLSSRIETGIAIDADDLAFVHQIEADTRELIGAGIPVRCRITHQGVVLELGALANAEKVRVAYAYAQATTSDSGRRWAGSRAYRRGSAFLHKVPQSLSD